MGKKYSDYVVLNLEWSSRLYRDRIPATLVANYLRMHGVKVIEESIFYGFNTLRKIRPHLFFKQGYIGAEVNYRVAKFGNENNLPMVMMTAEGNALEEFWINPNTYWGFNKDRKLLETVKLMWSERTKEYAKSVLTSSDFEKIKIAGGVNFDYYQIKKFKKRSEFLSKYKKNNFQKIVGIGCWDFGIVDERDHRYETIKELFTPDEMSRFRGDKSDFNGILKDVILENKDVLFLIKQHPGIDFNVDDPSGISGLENIDNVLLIHQEEDVSDCISTSDLWFVYESTTAMEAWLMGKQTGLINPSGTNFTRANLFIGSPNFINSEILGDAIKNFFESGSLKGFEDLEEQRRRCIEETMQWSDGLNHVRVGNVILDELEKIEIENRVKFRWKLDCLKEFIKWKICPLLKISRYLKHKRMFNKEEMFRNQQLLLGEQIDFYEKKNYSLEYLRSVKAK